MDVLFSVLKVWYFLFLAGKSPHPGIFVLVVVDDVICCIDDGLSSRKQITAEITYCYHYVQYHIRKLQLQTPRTTTGTPEVNGKKTREFIALLQLITVKPVLRGHLWDKEKVAI